MGTDEGKATDAILVVMSINLLVLAPLIAVIYYPEYGLSRQPIVAFVGAGVFGTLPLLGFVLYLQWYGTFPGRDVSRSADRRWFLFAGLTNTVFLLGYYAALGLDPVNIVSPITITNALFVVGLPAVFMLYRLERVT